MGLSRTVFEINGDFFQLLKIFVNPCAFNTRAKGVPVGIL